MEFSDLKIDTFIEKDGNELQVKYHCVCDDPANPKFTLLNQDGKVIYLTFNQIKEEGYVKRN